MAGKPVGREARQAAARQERYAAERKRELEILDAAAALDPKDNSREARHLREVAAGIQDDYDPEMRDKIIWGEI
jgi:hypothetical protein